MPAMATLHEFRSVGHRVGVVACAAEQRLDAVPGGTVDQRLLLARVPTATVKDLADVRAVIQDVVDGRAVELGPMYERLACSPLHLVGTVAEVIAASRMP